MNKEILVFICKYTDKQFVFLHRVVTKTDIYYAIHDKLIETYNMYYNRC